MVNQSSGIKEHNDHLNEEITDIINKLGLIDLMTLLFGQTLYNTYVKIQTNF